MWPPFIHQPRQEIFDLVNSLLLLAPGGRVVYCGPAYAFKEHMSALRYEPLNPGANIADFGMDVLAGFIPRVGESSADNVKETIEILCSWWSDNKIAEHETFLFNQKEIIARRMARMISLQGAQAQEVFRESDTGEAVVEVQTAQMKKAARNEIRDNVMSSHTLKTLYISMIRQLHVSLIYFVCFTFVFVIVFTVVNIIRSMTEPFQM